MANKSKQTMAIGVIAWIIAALFFLYEFFLRTFLGALAPQVIPALQLNASKFALVASVFYISYGLMQVPVGYIADRIGVKKSMLLATTICTTSAFLFAGSSGFYSALIYRLFMGFGGAFAFICLLVITIEWFPQKYIAGLIGFGQFIGTMGALCAGGPLATIVSHYAINWRFVFTVIGFVGVVLVVLTLLFVKKREVNNTDEVVVLENEMHPWRKLLSLINTHQAWYVAIYSAFVFLSVAMLGAVWGTTFLQSLHFKQSTAASIISLAWLGFAVGCPLLGAISDRFVKRKPVMIFCAVVGLISIALIVYWPHYSVIYYGILFFILGITSAGQSIGFAIITEHVAPELKSMALGLNSAFITLLAAVMPLIVGILVQMVAIGQHYHYGDFLLGFSLMPVLYFFACLLSIFFIKETYCRAQKTVVVLEVKR